MAKAIGLTPQYLQTGRVKSLDPHAFGRSTDELLHALPHFGGGFVGEGNRENLTGPELLIGQKMCDAVS